MKLSSNTLKIVVLSGLILILSCGKKSAGRPGIPGYYGNYSGFFNNLSPGAAANVAAYLNGYACPTGRIPEITFSASQAYVGNTTKIQGGLSPTPLGGAPSNSYIGVNQATRDVIVITKMTDGGRVLGFNISLSLCRFSKQINSNYGLIEVPIIHEARLPAVYGANPIIITDPTTCGVGSVDQATIGIYIPPYRVPNTNATFPPAQTSVSFTRANCIQ